MIEHKLIKGVTLTGSSGAGRKIGQKTTKELKKEVLEFGSNDAYIVLEDTGIENAVEQFVKGRIYNNRETCIATKRFVAVEKVYDKFKEGFVKAVKVGAQTDEKTKCGQLPEKT